MRSFKKTAAVLMLVSFVFTTVSPAMAAGIVSVNDAAGKNVYFGEYYQSLKGTAAGGSTDTVTRNNQLADTEFNKEAVSWRVLDTDAANGGMTVISERALIGAQQVQWNKANSDGTYGSKNNPATGTKSDTAAQTWALSDARTYLNGQFKTDAFGNVGGKDLTVYIKTTTNYTYTVMK